MSQSKPARPAAPAAVEPEVKTSGRRNIKIETNNEVGEAAPGPIESTVEERGGVTVETFIGVQVPANATTTVAPIPPVADEAE